ncbi:hypothetical protein COB11_04115 [Candidatus Aerophobetes bacterium]|uniref:Uncharacterized protein n=1 Tax=Aerophobetes bacterium TaxID=2030807 RepID=A0A2A4YHT4_UNCAE|nr:MAG: hypothetical protein COB11_04115 [Candidatus Aerophobetes bacterium]
MVPPAITIPVAPSIRIAFLFKEVCSEIFNDAVTLLAKYFEASRARLPASDSPRELLLLVS